MPNDDTTIAAPSWAGWDLVEAQAGRELLRVTLDSIGDAVIATDTDGCITSMNPVAEAITGWRAAEALGRRFEEVFRFEDAASGQPVENPLKRALRDGSPSNLAAGAVLLARDGRRVPVDDRGAPIRGEDDTLLGAVLVFRDVTELRRAEDDLHALNDDLELRVQDRTAELELARARSDVLAGLSNALHGAATPAAVAGVAIEALGPALAATYTVVYRRAGDTLRPLSTAGSMPDTPASRQHATAGIGLAEDGQGWDVVLSGVAEYTDDYGGRPVGHDYGVEIAIGAEPVCASDGTVLGVVACARPREVGPWLDGERDLLARAAATIGLALERAEAVDVIHDKQAEVAAQAAAMRAYVKFSEAAGTETDLYTLAGAAYLVMQAAVGEGQVAYWELEGDTWKGRGWWGDYDAASLSALQDGIPEVTPAHREIMASPDVVFFDGWEPSEHFGGAARGVGAAAGQRVLADGRPPAIVGFGLKGAARWSEIDRAMIQAVGRAMLQSVGHGQVAARLVGQTQELAERNAEQETFVYTVSHDLRGPLLSIRGMGELLGDAVARGDAGEAAFMLDRVNRNVEIMGDLLNDLLDLSRVGRASGKPEALDLGEAANTALTMLEPRLRELSVLIDLPPSWPRVRYLRSEALQVLVNLVGNAAKFAGRPSEDPRVRLGWTLEGDLVTLRVSDNGPGVAPAYRDRVFELFKQLDVRAEGTGVGLAIVKRIVERHGGTAWVEDADLGGATFAVTMPLA